MRRIEKSPAVLAAFFLMLCVAGTTITPNGWAAEPPPGLQPWRWLGFGVQRYTCVLSNGHRSWQPIGPNAVLTGMDGHLRGRHSSGPSWQALDGSRIVGSVLQSIPSPRRDAISWLALSVREHHGQGQLDKVAFVFRLDTEGGQPPSARCGSGTGAMTINVPYRAAYVFVPAADPVRPARPGG
jgi:hypothetical protein